MSSKRSPIEDPIRHAEQKEGGAFLEKKSVAPWAHWISRHTTGEFSNLGKNGYRRHCGPTAVTNILLTLHHRHPFLPRPVSSRELFLQVSELGRKKRIYWNTDFLKHFGGTYDILTGIYLREALARFGGKASVTPAMVPTKRGLLRALEAGDLIYLQLSHNRLYGSHHLLCYGYTTLRELHSGKEVTYLILADGWGKAPRYLPLSDLFFFHYFKIR